MKVEVISMSTLVRFLTNCGQNAGDSKAVNQRTNIFQKSPADKLLAVWRLSSQYKVLPTSQWYWPLTNAAYSYILRSFMWYLFPHFPALKLHLWHWTANWELSSSIFWNELQDKGSSSVWPLKYWTTAAPALPATVVTWNLPTCCLLQWNLSWVKDKCAFSLFMALVVIPILLLWYLLIPRYDVSTANPEGRVELSGITTLATRSQPPEIRKNCHFITQVKGAQSRYFELFWPHTKLPFNGRKPENKSLVR